MEFEMSRFKTKLIWQIIPVLLIVLIPAFIVGGYIACKEVLQLCLKQQKSEITHAVELMEKRITDDSEYEWLLSYWSENSESLREIIVYDSPEALLTAKKDFGSSTGISADTITRQQLDGLETEYINQYAAIRLMELILDFDNMKEVYSFKYLYLSKMISDKDMLFIVSGLGKGDVRGVKMHDVFELGVHADPGLDYHPVLKEIYETGVRVNELEQKMKEGRTGYDYNLFIPIILQDGSKFVICGCMEAATIQKEIYTRVSTIIVIYVFILVLGIALMIVALKKVMLNPLEIVQGQIRKYSEDKNSAKLCETLGSIKSQNEIGKLSFDVSELAIELDRHMAEVAELSAENQRIETELDLARQIQKAALPSEVPVFNGTELFRITGISNPAKEVGGDFYDYFKIDDNHMGIIVADVSGKGVPAAMFMMLSHICIKNMSLLNIDPGTVFEKVNNILMERNDMEMFVTAWFGVFNLNTGIIECVNAGHEYPAVYRRNGEYSLLKTKHSFVLAGMENTKYKTEQIKLEPGDKLFLYTDGVPEATNKEDELYGTQRMLNVLNEVKNADCYETLEAVKRSISSFVEDAPQFDDFTMVCVELVDYRDN